VDEVTTLSTHWTFSEEERMPENTERLVWSVEEAGRLLGISRAHAYELVARGEIPHLRLGRRLVVPKCALEALVSARAGAS
jgi:excisionase family DNA binding protein